MIAEHAVQKRAAFERARGAGAENFPVSSRVLSARVRGPVMAFYIFARTADNLADDPLLDPAVKLARLAEFEAGLDGHPGASEAVALRRQIDANAEGIACGRALLGAFRMDAVGRSYLTWADLRNYCALSADPVGRFLLQVHGEATEARVLSDPLCTALQILNHLQDLGEDHVRLGRVYLPGDWLAAENIVPADLSLDAATPGLRRVIDRGLDACDDLLADAAALPSALRDPGLRMQAQATLLLARGLSRDLRRADPLAGRVAPTRWQVAGAVARAAMWRVTGR